MLGPTRTRERALQPTDRIGARRLHQRFRDNGFVPASRRQYVLCGTPRISYQFPRAAQHPRADSALGDRLGRRRREMLRSGALHCRRRIHTTGPRRPNAPPPKGDVCCGRLRAELSSLVQGRTDQFPNSHGKSRYHERTIESPAESLSLPSKRTRLDETHCVQIITPGPAMRLSIAMSCSHQAQKRTFRPSAGVATS